LAQAILEIGRLLVPNIQLSALQHVGTWASQAHHRV